jgi:hypothetical protein
MHASPMGQFKQAEIALVCDGAGAEVIEPDLSEIKKSEVAEIVKQFPRLKFKDAFVKTCAGVVRRHPRGASGSFMRCAGVSFREFLRPDSEGAVPGIARSRRCLGLEPKMRFTPGIQGSRKCRARPWQETRTVLNGIL